MVATAARKRTRFNKDSIRFVKNLLFLLLLCVIHLIIVGNKLDRANADVKNRDVSIEEGIAFATKNNLDFLEASALSKANVEKMFRRVSLSVAKLLPDVKQHLELLDLPEGWLAVMPPPLERASSAGSADMNVSAASSGSPSSSLEAALRVPVKTNSFHDSPESFRPVGIDANSAARRRSSMRKECSSPSGSQLNKQSLAPRVRYINYWTGEDSGELPTAPADPGLLYTAAADVAVCSAEGDEEGSMSDLRPSEKKAVDSIGRDSFE